jgi:hypothetical protein
MPERHEDGRGGDPNDEANDEARPHEVHADSLRLDESVATKVAKAR